MNSETMPDEKPDHTPLEPRAQAVFDYFWDNGLPPPLNSEIYDLLGRVDKADRIDPALLAAIEKTIKYCEANDCEADDYVDFNDNITLGDLRTLRGMFG